MLYKGKKIFSRILAIHLVLAMGSFGQYATWTHSATITINTTPTGANLGGGASVTNFPVLVTLGKGYFDFSQAKADGSDIRFASAGSTALPYEIDFWDGVNGNAALWVLVDQIQGNSTQNITMYWGKSDATSESNGAAVFNPSNNYIAVWHLGEDGNTATDGYKDVTGNDIHGTGFNTNLLTDKPSIIGKGQSFDGTNFIDIPRGGVYIPNGTFHHWIKFHSGQPGRDLQGIFNGDAWGGGTLHYQMSTSGINFDGAGQGNKRFANSVIDFQKWNLIAITLDTANTEMKLYANGELLDTQEWKVNARVDFINKDYSLGGWAGYTDPQRHSYATHDEFRISSTARSADWLKLSYQNQRLDQVMVSLPKVAGCTQNFGVAQATVQGNEGTNIVVAGTAECADRFYWVEMDGNVETPIPGNLPLVLDIGRISADSTINLKLKALYGIQWQTADVIVQITKTLVNPIFTLTSDLTGANWDGKSVVTIQPNITNLTAIQAQVQPFNNIIYEWDVTGVPAKYTVTGNTLVLTYAYAQTVPVSLCLKNGGAPTCQNISISTDLTANPTQKELEPVKIFIMAGQSNTEGHGQYIMDPDNNSGKGTLEYILINTESPELYEHLIDRESGDWMIRDDVWIKYDDRQGGLSVGYGVSANNIGPELGFGHVLGNGLNSQVLLLKVCRGGRALATNFRPPSSGSYSPPQAESDTGYWYEQIPTRYTDLVNNLATYFPGYAGQGYELAGFGWHQGWNDGLDPERIAEYAENMANFIRDIRVELGAPDMPFVIAENGNMCEGRPEFCQAQLAAAQLPEFSGTVAAVKTRDFWVPSEDSPTGQGSHWNGNGGSYLNIGNTMGAAMMALLEDKPLSLLSPNGGEQIGKGSTITIQWLVNSNIPNVKLDYSLDAGATWVSITASVPASDGTFSWTVPDAEHPSVIVRVSSLDGSVLDQSNTSFGLITPVVQKVAGNLTFQIAGGNSYSLSPSVSRIEIFNTSGRRVRTFHVNGPLVTWNGRGDAGNMLEAGLYLARLVSEHSQKSLKLIWQ